MDINEPIIKLEGIRFGYPERPLLFDQFDLEFKQKDRIGLVGPNGSGKTTLFHIMVGLLKPMGGSLTVFGLIRTTESDFREVREKIGLLFQDSDDQLFCPTVGEDIAFGPLNLGKPRSDVNEIVEETLEILELKGFENRVTYNLSSGEKRLVSLATVLAMRPKALLLDEPTNGLDENVTKKVIQVLNNLEISLMIISHDRDFLNETTGKRYYLRNGKIQQA
jgi:cobalt/nickel transport system ATP-binding protein